MSTQYDQIGSRHKSLEDSPVGEVDFESTSKALGDVSGLKVLDLACGIGRWSKWLVNNGAKEVVGIDISEGMIKGAKDMQAGLPKELAQKLDFSVKDCGLPLTVEEGGFDLVLGAWYLSNASDHEGLVTMFRNVLINLKPGGRFLGIVPNAFVPMYEAYDIHGLRMDMNEQAAEGHWKCTLSYKADNIAFKTNIRLHGLYERAATEAGLGEIRWRPYVLPKGDQREEQGFWDEFKLRPHLCLLECYRSA
ncbi:hypothetical protein CKM354_000696600 [Cercospora kikuchii]|uniref:Methyltransferase domain-containing protein n=1 Tax=Cercospora kikuchii TaxID=84275 RepID=A0A9P3CQ68_9PEZI|nr:uncharacterized protein CKM354_000696600 [Cercospora kikuchii]GIZ43750.1 hypothetical protein CKM354_000696600 [Cercospora kikuchii]